MSHSEAERAELAAEIPICLYLELDRGKRPNLEAVANALLAFNAAIKELAFVLDPSLDLEVEFLSGTEGSLLLNYIIKSLKKVKKPSKNAMFSVAGAIALYFASHTRDYGLEKFLDKITGQDEGVHLSKKDKDEIIAGATEAISKKIALPQAQEIYRHLNSDKRIKGVGLSAGKDEVPDKVVPRSEFSQRSGNIQEHEHRTRNRYQRETLVLISPVLLDSKRLWEFSGAEGKLSAIMGDPNFLNRILSGTSSLKLTGGIQLDVDLETKEELIEHVWHIKSRVISKVYGTGSLPEQTVMDLP